MDRAERNAVARHHLDARVNPQSPVAGLLREVGIESEAGSGTTVSVMLPRAEGE